MNYGKKIMVKFETAEILCHLDYIEMNMTKNIIVIVIKLGKLGIPETTIN